MIQYIRRRACARACGVHSCLVPGSWCWGSGPGPWSWFLGVLGFGLNHFKGRGPNFIADTRAVSRDFLITICLTSSWTSHFSVFGVNLAPCWLPTWLHVGSSWPKLASCWLKLAQVGLMLAQVGSNWLQVASMLLQIGLNLV